MTTPKDLREVPGWEGYLAEANGAIWSTRWGNANRSVSVWSPKKLKPMIGDNGYRFLWCTKDGKKRKAYVHRLVLLAFAGIPRPGQQARHLDGCKTNNKLENLRWGTALENAADKVGHYRTTKETDRPLTRGENNGMARLTEKQVFEIRRYRSEGITSEVLAKRYAVSGSHIRQIARYKIWKHLS